MSARRRGAIAACLAFALSGCLESAQPLIVEAEAVTPLEVGFYQDCKISRSGAETECKQVHVRLDERRQYRSIDTADSAQEFMLGRAGDWADAVVQARLSPVRTVYGYARRNGDEWIAVFPMCKALSPARRERLIADGLIQNEQAAQGDCIFRTLEGVRGFLSEAAADALRNGPLVEGAERHRLRRHPDYTAFVAAVRDGFRLAVAGGYWEQVAAIAGLQARYVYDTAVRSEVLTGLAGASDRIDAWVRSREKPADRDKALVVQAWASFLATDRVPDLRPLATLKDDSPSAPSAMVLGVTLMAVAGHDDVEACRKIDQFEVLFPTLEWPLADWMRIARSTAKCG